MSQTYLDLDAVAPIEKTFKFKGKTHEILPISVEDFIRNAKRAREGDTQDLGVDQQVALMVELIAPSVPTLPVTELRKMSVKQLNALLAFIRTEDGTEEGNKEAAAAAERSPQ
jgi:hypothetical protein